MFEELSPLAINVASESRRQVVSVSGELDLVTSPQLQCRLDAVIDSSTDDVQVDLADVGFIDSTGLCVLLTAHDRLSKSGRRLRVRNASTQVKRLFEICGVTYLNEDSDLVLDAASGIESEAG